MVAFLLPLAAAAASVQQGTIRYAPLPSVRTALLQGDSDRFPYPGNATVNAVLASFDDIVVRLLMDSGRRRTEGPGALLAAIQRPDPAMVALILATGVDPNAVDGGGVGSLAYAVSAGEDRTICLLADYGVDFTPGPAPHQPMLVALTSGSLDAAQLLVALGYVAGDDERGRLHALGKKRGQSTLWDTILAKPKDTLAAEAMCRRIQAVPPLPTRLEVRRADPPSPDVSTGRHDGKPLGIADP